MWFTSVSGIASSLAWVCDVGTVLSVLSEVVEVGMSWGRHVRCAGSGLVLCSGRVLYVAKCATQDHYLVRSYYYTPAKFSVRLRSRWRRSLGAQKL